MINLDFTFAAYRKLLMAISRSGLEVYTVEKYLQSGKPAKGVILRHDADLSIKKALRLAQIENSFGISTTYYFRIPKTFNEEIIREIHGLGHEVGYHFEVLDKTSGDYERAVRLFVDEINQFRQKTGIDITTVCSHGGLPYDGREKTGYKLNLDIFDYAPGLYDETEILGEAYRDIGLSNTTYFSDSQARWHYIPDIWGIIEHIESNPERIVYILAHPDHWNATVLGLGYQKMKRMVVPILLKSGTFVKLMKKIRLLS